MKTKPCSKCKEIKPLTEFNKNKNLKYGVQSQCRDCTKQWRPTPEARLISNKRTREWNRKKSSGFTPKDFQETLANQNNKCAICGTDDPGKTNWHADHDHKTKQKRGVLCQKCNTGLGLLQDDIDILCSAIEYLKKYSK